MKRLKTVFREEQLINFYEVAEVINDMVSNKKIYSQKDNS